MAMVGRTILQFVLCHLNAGTYGDNVIWTNESEGIFKIRWISKKKKSWKTSFCDIFQDWATEKQDYVHRDDYEKLKGRFRNALNSRKGVFTRLKESEQIGYRFYQIDLSALEEKVQKKQKKSRSSVTTKVRSTSQEIPQRTAQVLPRSDVNKTVSSIIPVQFQILDQCGRPISVVIPVASCVLNPQIKLPTVPEALSVNSNENCAFSFNAEACNSIVDNMEGISCPDLDTMDVALQNFETTPTCFPNYSDTQGNYLVNAGTGQECLLNSGTQNKTSVDAVIQEVFHNTQATSDSEKSILNSLLGSSYFPDSCPKFPADCNALETNAANSVIPEEYPAFSYPALEKNSLGYKNVEPSYMNQLLCDDSLDLKSFDDFELSQSTGLPDPRSLSPQTVRGSPSPVQDETSLWATSAEDNIIVKKDRMLSETISDDVSDKSEEEPDMSDFSEEYCNLSESMFEPPELR